MKSSFAKGNIYEVVNVTLGIVNSSNSVGYEAPFFTKSLYINETLGTMIVDEDYFIKKYGQLEYIARVDEFNPAGLILTDYLADAIILTSSLYRNKTYNDLLGVYYF